MIPTDKDRKYWRDYYYRHRIEVLRNQRKRRKGNVDYRARDCERARKWRKHNPVSVLLTAARMRAKQGGIRFSITKEDVVIPKVCPVLGIPLTRNGPRTYNTPSLDRVVPERGYVKGNVVVVSWRANNLKRDASLEELRRMWEFYSNFNKKGKR